MAQEQSGLSRVSGKRTNICTGLHGDPVERRERTEGNADRMPWNQTATRAAMRPGLEQVREPENRAKKQRFSALLGHADADLLQAVSSWDMPDSALGVNGPM